ncbi:hypothetical protein SAMN06265360_11081 [Haloechinothrix alba]|uniref:Uncharacterized protein n=1 Tax=Haloechinothrix alba TaxID=664784 RepID=A0A238XBU6_9PSEU|nr:hypothetical protein [Haloechinothrix alba]SNR56545.1 hypothetical protein SAMN06265360_11081 [Haloechinothrix alba]
MSAHAEHGDSATPRSRPSRMMALSVGLFVIGMIAVAAVFVLFALGHTDLPVWLSVSAIGFTSVGFGSGLVTLVREARSL